MESDAVAHGPHRERRCEHGEDEAARENDEPVGGNDLIACGKTGRRQQLAKPFHGGAARGPQPGWQDREADEERDGPGDEPRGRDEPLLLRGVAAARRRRNGAVGRVGH